MTVRMQLFPIRAAALSSCLLLAACGAQPTAPSDSSRITLTQDEAALNARVQYYEDESIPLYSLDLSTDLNHIAQQNGFQIKLRAEVAPPRFQGHTLHAVHVTFDKRRAYVAYSTVNDTYRGAVEIYDITRKSHPRILSQALFADTDITIAARFGDKLFLGEATDSNADPRFNSPACLETIELRDNRLTDRSQRVDLPSFNANDIACFDSTIFVTSGTTHGAVSLFHAHSLTLSHKIELEGAKAVDHSEREIVVMEGTGTRLHLFNRKTREFVRTIEIGCTNFFQAKAEIQVVNEKVFLSAWECGVKVVDLGSGAIAATIPAPDGGHCNAVSVDGDLIFMADGSDGLLIAKMDGTGYEILGRAKFDGSTNFVAARENTVFVANGTGGLKILEIVR
ncbi:MAG: hypothetical protein D6743_12755 [Calditrichaeota bacterium]|nr:MAG: hypothetical protein D6743_12755 [Calditrichota bacterium]